MKAFCFGILGILATAIFIVPVVLVVIFIVVSACGEAIMESLRGRQKQ